MNRLYEEILKDGECVTLKDLAVKGGDLAAWGMKQGKEMGEMLSLLLDKVLETPSLNDKDRLYECFLEIRQNRS